MHKKYPVFKQRLKISNIAEKVPKRTTNRCCIESIEKAGYILRIYEL
jgi:hypothetical protein